MYSANSSRGASKSSQSIGARSMRFPFPNPSERLRLRRGHELYLRRAALRDDDFLAAVCQCNECISAEMAALTVASYATGDLEASFRVSSENRSPRTIESVEYLLPSVVSSAHST